MIDTDKYESMRLLFLDFIDTASDEVDEEAWRNKLTMLDDLLAEVKRLSEIEQEWLVMWATLEELNLVADVRKNMTLHGFVFPTDEDMEGEEE